MAVFEATNRFPREVSVRIPDPRVPGKYQVQKFVAIFETVEREELDAMINDKRSITDLLGRVFKGADGVKDKEGNDIDSEMAVQICMQNAIVSTAIRDEFWKAISGSVKS